MRPRSVTDADIIDAARACLLDVGPSVSVAAIAARVGITGPGVLKRFGSKENLVMRALLSEPPPDLSHGPSPGPLRAQLIETLLHTERLLLGAVPKLATLRAGGVRASQWLDKAHPRKARESLHGWLVKAQKTHGLSHPDLEAAADLLIALVEARGFLSWVEPTWVETGNDWAPRAVDALFGDLRQDARKGRAPAGTRRTRAAKS
jgi:AcrR family transcriptional regulator